MGNQISKKPSTKANRNSTFQDSSYKQPPVNNNNNNTNTNGKQQQQQQQHSNTSNGSSNGQIDRKAAGGGGVTRTSQDTSRGSWQQASAAAPVPAAQTTSTTTTAPYNKNGNNNNAGSKTKPIQPNTSETNAQSSTHQQRDQQTRNGAAGSAANTDKRSSSSNNPHGDPAVSSSSLGVRSGQSSPGKDKSGATAAAAAAGGGSDGQGSQQQDQPRRSMETMAQGTNGSSQKTPNHNNNAANGQTNHPQSNGAHRGDTQGGQQPSPQQQQQQQQQEGTPSMQPPSYPAPSIPFAVTSPGNPILVRKHNLAPLVITPQIKGTPPPLSSPMSAGQKKSSEISPTARLPFIGSVTQDKNGKIMDIDDMISRLLDAGYSGKIAKSVCLKNSEILAICQSARDVLLSQPTLIELNAPVKIVGDIHGQYTDLLRLFEMCGFPPSANFLFLGDYVDRGRMSLETILLLFCYKIKYPENFFLLRGNHECANVTKVYGFYDECKRRASIKMWKAFVDVFNCLPIAAIVANKIFCVHGGLSPSLATMADIRAIRRPTDVPDYGLLNDLLWSDPSETALDWEDNERGVSYCFGGSIIQKFLNKHDFDLVCRAHMVVEDGYEFFNDRTLVTVFSAPNYCGEFDNFGAVMSVNEDLLCSFELLKPIDQATARAQMQSLAASSGGWRVNKQRLSDKVHPSEMLSSLHRKVSAFVHSTPTNSTEQATPTRTPSNTNWDITIIFKGAKDLPRGDLLSSDPFLEAYLGPPEDKTSLSFVTGVEWATLNPKWDATWSLLNVTDGMDLQIQVKDKNKMMVDTNLGHASLRLGAHLEGTREHFIDIWKSDSRRQGQLIIETTAFRSHGVTAALTKPSTKGPARYSRHTSYAAGVLTKDRKMEFYTYRIRLYHLTDIFGIDSRFYQGWSRAYEASQRIFADTLDGLNIRNALHSQHALLYRHGRSTVYGALGTADEVGELLHGDRLRKEPDTDLKTVVFTYSIIPKGMYFSETGKAFFQDFMSKHAMHANRATEVLYAGEFRLFRDEHHNNDWTLLIDNNSGTYAPNKEELHKVQQVFQLNFPDLVVKAVDREDPYLKSLVEATKKAEAAQASQQSQRMTLFGANSGSSEEEVLNSHSLANHHCDVK
ncbi:hypothetical protein EC991_006990 [Linnemannia zychae]|nr:hypothetical protein EC991_006990 [Linnemannia zychae]